MGLLGMGSETVAFFSIPMHSGRKNATPGSNRVQFCFLFLRHGPCSYLADLTTVRCRES
jgi:hypothetical protein